MCPVLITSTVGSWCQAGTALKNKTNIKYHQQEKKRSNPVALMFSPLKLFQLQNETVILQAACSTSSAYFLTPEITQLLQSLLVSGYTKGQLLQERKKSRRPQGTYGVQCHHIWRQWAELERCAGDKDHWQSQARRVMKQVQGPPGSPVRSKRWSQEQDKTEDGARDRTRQKTHYLQPRFIVHQETRVETKEKTDTSTMPLVPGLKAQACGQSLDLWGNSAQVGSQMRLLKALV